MSENEQKTNTGEADADQLVKPVGRRVDADQLPECVGKVIVMFNTKKIVGKITKVDADGGYIHFIKIGGRFDDQEFRVMFDQNGREIEVFEPDDLPSSLLE